MFFFFKQKTAYEMCGRDWSSDVCSSDLVTLSFYLIRIEVSLNLPFRAIVIVRHPLDATVSGFNFFNTGGSHLKTASMTKFLKADGMATVSKFYAN